MKSELLVFFGNERLATAVKSSTPTLTALVAAGYKVSAVVVNQKQAQSRQQRELEISTVAKKYNIPLLTDAEIGKLASLKAKFGVLAAFGQIIPRGLLELFPGGILNVHPSLLPRYRGPTPIEQAILDGATKTGVSIIRLAEKMDAGPIFAQAALKLPGNEPKQGLADSLGKLGAELLVKTLPLILSDSQKFQEQDESQATYTSKITRQSGVIDWQKPAEILERQIRAYLGWPGSQTQLAGKDVVVTRAHIIEKAGKPGDIFYEGGGFGVYCGQNALVIERIKPAGRSEISGADFRRGYLR